MVEKRKSEENTSVGIGRKTEVRELAVRQRVGDGGGCVDWNSDITHPTTEVLVCK